MLKIQATTYQTEEFYLGYNNNKKKNSQNSIVKRTDDLNRKQTKDMNRHFTKEDIQMANQHMKRYST